VLVQETEPVKEGAVLLQLEDKPARHRVEEAQAALAAAGNQLVQARKGMETHQERLVQQQAAVEAMSQRLAAARIQLTRKEELLRIDQANSQDVNTARHQVKEVESLEKAEQGKLAELKLVDPDLEVRNALTQVTVMESRLKQAKDALEECKLKAPQAGTVLRILAGPGDVVGVPGQKPVILFAGAGPRLVRVEVEQEFARRVKTGMPAKVEDDTDPSRVWTGKVMRVSDWYTQRRAILQEGPTLHDVRTVECLIALEPDQTAPRLGLRVQVTIKPEEGSSITRSPRTKTKTTS
jgi:multidrug resistance efflux pump